MTLSSGDRLAHYEILELLGQGGMGEVYRARDTKLKREVALKVLPATFASDPDRMGRFQREAEVLASLNHPHIAHIYGVAESENSRALAMELVEGTDLPCPLPFEIARDYARQIAEALEYAHERGVIHRDLKPANIKVTPEGTVKLLDFGLAKAIEGPRAEPGDSTTSPTITLGQTQMGVVMGSAAYMAPEQAAGANVDRRADIWSFGAVLFEMLSGKRAFAGESVADTLATVMKLEPEWSALPNDTPKALEQLVRRCLTKNRKQRLQAIGEARIILERPLDSSPAEDPQPAALVPMQPGRTRLIPWVAAALFAVVAGAVSFLHFRETPPEIHPVNTTLLPPENGEFEISTAPYAIPAISPDGTRVVYGARLKDGKQQLWLRRLDSPTAQPLPGTEGAATPFWSPDSRWIGFGQELKLKKIDTQGGPPVVVTELAAALRGGTWNADGVILFGVNFPGPIMRVAASGGLAKPATYIDPSQKDKSLSQGVELGGNPRQPWFLPDGRHFLYVDTKVGDMPILVGSLDDLGKPGKLVGQAHSSAVYAQGNLLYLRESTLMAQPFDVTRLTTTGEAVPLAESVPTFTNPSRVAGFAVSPSGLLIYATGAGGGQSQLVWKDRQGRPSANLGSPTGLIGSIDLSPDGKRGLVSRAGAGNSEDLWTYDIARGIPTRLTFDPNTERNPAWSSDGNTIFFQSNRNGPYEIFRKASNGTGTEELTLAGGTSSAPTSVSPDGKLLLYSQLNDKTRNDMWVLPLTGTSGGGKPEPKVFLQTPFNEGRGQFSPDGKWVLYQSDESNQSQIYAAPFPGPGGKRQISAKGGSNPRWRRDGKEVFYVTPQGELMAVDVSERNDTLDIGRSEKLFDGIVTSRGTLYDITADGQKFLVADDGTSTSRPLTLLQNWTATLRK